MSSRGKFAGLAYDCDRSVFQTRLGRLDDRVGEIAEKRKKSLGERHAAEVDGWYR
jgi:hypothetical protein